MNYARYNPICYSGTEWSCGGDGEDGGDDDDDDPMKPSSMTVTMAMISPLREEISPADFSLLESFSLSVVFRPVEVAEYFLDDSSSLRVSGG